MHDHNDLEQLNAVMSRLDERRAGENERHQNRLRHIAAMKSAVTNSVIRYLKTGIAVMNASQLTELEEEGVKMRGRFQEIARQLGRPYLRAEEYFQNVYCGVAGNKGLHVVELTVPNTKRLTNVVSGLLLVAKTALTIEAPIRAGDESPLFLCERTGSWVFWFVGGQGRALFDAFVERCHTDPVMRVILKL